MKKKILQFGVCLSMLLGFITLSMTHAQQGPDFAWAKSMGGLGADLGQGIATDAQGYSYATGYFNGTAYFGTDTLISVGGTDVFISRLDPDGNILWGKKTGGSGADWGRAITVDENGNSYITGNYELTANFGTTLLTAQGSSDVFAAKIDSSGTIVWAKSFGGKIGDIGYGIDVDQNGFVYITGTYADTAIFGNDTLITNGLNDIFVVKLNSTGDVVWAKGLGGTANEISRGIALGVDGSIQIAGFFTTSGTTVAQFDSISFTSTGNSDIFVAKLDPLGNAVWAKKMGGSSQDQGLGVAVDALGNVFTTGMFQSTAYFDTITFVSYTPEIFVAKHFADGSFGWAKQIGSTSSDYGYGIDLDKAGNVYTTGMYNRTVDFNPGIDTFLLTASSNSSEVFVLKLSNSGDFVWAKSMGGTGGDAAAAISVNPSGHVYANGYFNGTADFNPAPSDTFNLISLGGNDIFVVKLACTADSATIQVTASCDTGYTINQHIYYVAGTYTETLTNANGCDSFVTFTLSLVGSHNVAITINGFVLGTTQPYVSYQWILNGASISGATNSTFLVQQNGDYQVAVVDNNGCFDTSVVYTVDNHTSIHNASVLANQVELYPNPAKNMIYLKSPIPVNIEVFTLQGRSIISDENVKSMDINTLPGGMYLFKIKDQENRLIKVEKLVKDN